jgi:RNA polymerase sigma factor for flagellar operon FliA
LYELLSELQDNGFTLAKYIVTRHFINALDYHDIDDLVSLALLGILEAVKKFDQSKGVKLETFACYKAKQSIIGFLRQVRNQHIQSIEEIPDVEYKIKRYFG